MALFPVLEGFLVKRAEVLIGSYLLGTLFTDRAITGAGFLGGHSPVTEIVGDAATGAVFGIVLGCAVYMHAGTIGELHPVRHLKNYSLGIRAAFASSFVANTRHPG